MWAIELTGGFGFLLRATLVTLVTAAMATLAMRGLQTALAHGFGVNEETRRRFPHLEERLSRYRGVVEVTARSIVVVIAVLVVLDAWGLNTFSWLTSEGGRQLIGHLLTIVFVTGAALVAWEVLGTLVEGMSIRSVRLRDIEGTVHTVPFGEVASVLNMTKDFSFAFMEVGIAYPGGRRPGRRGAP